MSKRFAFEVPLPQELQQCCNTVVYASDYLTHEQTNHIIETVVVEPPCVKTFSTAFRDATGLGDELLVTKYPLVAPELNGLLQSYIRVPEGSELDHQLGGLCKPTYPLDDKDNFRCIQKVDVYKNHSWYIYTWGLSGEFAAFLRDSKKTVRYTLQDEAKTPLTKREKAGATDRLSLVLRHSDTTFGTRFSFTPTKGLEWVIIKKLKDLTIAYIEEVKTYDSILSFGKMNTSDFPKGSIGDDEVYFRERGSVKEVSYTFSCRMESIDEKLENDLRDGLGKYTGLLSVRQKPVTLKLKDQDRSEIELRFSVDLALGNEDPTVLREQRVRQIIDNTLQKYSSQFISSYEIKIEKNKATVKIIWETMASNGIQQILSKFPKDNLRGIAITDVRVIKTGHGRHIIRFNCNSLEWESAMKKGSTATVQPLDKAMMVPAGCQLVESYFCIFTSKTMRANSEVEMWMGSEFEVTTPLTSPYPIFNMKEDDFKISADDFKRGKGEFVNPIILNKPKVPADIPAEMLPGYVVYSRLEKKRKNVRVNIESLLLAAHPMTYVFNDSGKDLHVHSYPDFTYSSLFGDSEFTLSESELEELQKLVGIRLDRIPVEFFIMQQEIVSRNWQEVWKEDSSGARTLSTVLTAALTDDLQKLWAAVNDNSNKPITFLDKLARKYGFPNYETCRQALTESVGKETKEVAWQEIWNDSPSSQTARSLYTRLMIADDLKTLYAGVAPTAVLDRLASQYGFLTFEECREFFSKRFGESLGSKENDASQEGPNGARASFRAAMIAYDFKTLCARDEPIAVLDKLAGKYGFLDYEECKECLAKSIGKHSGEMVVFQEAYQLLDNQNKIKPKPDKTIQIISAYPANFTFDGEMVRFEYLADVTNEMDEESGDLDEPDLPITKMHTLEEFVGHLVELKNLSEDEEKAFAEFKSDLNKKMFDQQMRIIREMLEQIRASDVLIVAFISWLQQLPQIASYGVSVTPQFITQNRDLIRHIIRRQCEPYLAQVLRQVHYRMFNKTAEMERLPNQTLIARQRNMLDIMLSACKVYNAKHVMYSIVGGGGALSGLGDLTCANVLKAYLKIQLEALSKDYGFEFLYCCETREAVRQYIRELIESEGYEFRCPLIVTDTDQMRLAYKLSKLGKKVVYLNSSNSKMMFGLCGGNFGSLDSAESELAARTTMLCTSSRVSDRWRKKEYVKNHHKDVRWAQGSNGTMRGIPLKDRTKQEDYFKNPRLHSVLAGLTSSLVCYQPRVSAEEFEMHCLKWAFDQLMIEWSSDNSTKLGPEKLLQYNQFSSQVCRVVKGEHAQKFKSLVESLKLHYKAELENDRRENKGLQTSVNKDIRDFFTEYEKKFRGIVERLPLHAGEYNMAFFIRNYSSMPSSGLPGEPGKTQTKEEALLRLISKRCSLSDSVFRENNALHELFILSEGSMPVSTKKKFLLDILKSYPEHDVPWGKLNSSGQAPVHIAASTMPLLSTLAHWGESTAPPGKSKWKEVSLCEDATGKTVIIHVIETMALTSSDEAYFEFLDEPAEASAIEIIQSKCRAVGDMNAFMMAIQKGLYAICQKIIARLKDLPTEKMQEVLNLKSKNSQTVLHYALEQSKISSMKFVIDDIIALMKPSLRKGRDQTRDEFGDTYLHLAVKYGNRRAAQQFIRWGFNLEAVNASKEKPLDKLNKYDKIILRNFLQQKNCDVGGDTSITRIHSYATANANATRLRQEVEDKYASAKQLSERTTENITPVQVALYANKPDHVRYLLERGAEIDYERDLKEHAAGELRQVLSSITRADDDCDKEFEAILRRQRKNRKMMTEELIHRYEVAYKNANESWRRIKGRHTLSTTANVIRKPQFLITLRGESCGNGKFSELSRIFDDIMLGKIAPQNDELKKSISNSIETAKLFALMKQKIKNSDVIDSNTINLGAKLNAQSSITTQIVRAFPSFIERMINEKLNGEERTEALNLLTAIKGAPATALTKWARKRMDIVRLLPPGTDVDRRFVLKNLRAFKEKVRVEEIEEQNRINKLLSDVLQEELTLDEIAAIHLVTGDSTVYERLHSASFDTTKWEMWTPFYTLLSSAFRKMPVPVKMDQITVFYVLRLEDTREDPNALEALSRRRLDTTHDGHRDFISWAKSEYRGQPLTDTFFLENEKSINDKLTGPLRKSFEILCKSIRSNERAEVTTIVCYFRPSPDTPKGVGARFVDLMAEMIKTGALENKFAVRWFGNERSEVFEGCICVYFELTFMYPMSAGIFENRDHIDFAVMSDRLGCYNVRRIPGQVFSFNHHIICSAQPISIHMLSRRIAEKEPLALLIINSCTARPIYNYSSHCEDDEVVIYPNAKFLVKNYIKRGTAEHLNVNHELIQLEEVVFD